MGTIEIKAAIFLIIVHFLADFGLQTHDQATNKSTSPWYLFLHVGTYALVWFFAMLAYTDSLTIAFVFSAVTFALHYATDYVTSKVSKKFFDAKDFHNGFVVVGFDQVLHAVQLLITYQLCMQLIAH